MADETKGACLCKGVRFKVQGTPMNVFICYCFHCSLNAGAPGQISAKFKSQQVHIDEGADLTSTWILKDNLSGFEKHKVFCSQCGCTLWTIPMRHGGTEMVIRTALLENGLERFPYRAEFFASRKKVVAEKEVKSFESMPGF